jgi:hypothetical protein
MFLTIHSTSQPLAADVLMNSGALRWIQNLTANDSSWSSAGHKRVTRCMTDCGDAGLVPRFADLTNVFSNYPTEKVRGQRQ